MASESRSRISRTAKGTAICRAMADLETTRETWETDHLARYFLKPMLAKLLGWGAFRSFVKRRVLTPGVFEYVVARTRHMDGLFLKALTENWPQIVLVGAGYDSRSERFGERIRKTTIFEIDAPATQSHKRECIEKAGLAWPKQTQFVSSDLTHEEMASLLAEAGYDSHQKSLFILEGLTMYLPEASVRALFALVAQNTAPGTTLAFDYFYKSVVEGRSDAYGAKEQYMAVKKAGEPFQFGLESDQMCSLVEGYGFRINAHHNPDAFEKTYLSPDNGDGLKKIYRCSGNVVAVLNPDHPQ